MIHLITGGQRSGKSNYALQLALKLSDKPIYIATSRVWDEEHKERINIHKSGRGDSWETIEEEKNISRLNLKDRTVVLDCVTLWLTNFFTDLNYNVEETLSQCRNEFSILCKNNFNLIVVTNEIGMGVHAPTVIGRKFCDVQGWMNQYIATLANEVTLMACGIPLKIK